MPCPVIDVISDDTFEYLSGSEMTYGGFDAHFVFDWIPVPDRENTRRNNDRSLPLRFVFKIKIVSTQLKIEQKKRERERISILSNYPSI